jgi:hypothetical protein
VIENVHAAAVGLAPQLDQHPDQGGTLGQARDGQDHVGDERITAASVPEREHALEDGESGPGDENAERGQQRPEVPFLAVTERVTLVGGPFAAMHGGQQERLVEGVRRRVGRLGQHGTGADHDARRELDRPDRDVRGARDEHGPAGRRPFRHAVPSGCSSAR